MEEPFVILNRNIAKSLCSINIREDVFCLMFIFGFLINIAFELFTMFDYYL